MSQEAFARAAARLFARLGEVALYRPVSGGEMSVRAILRRPDETASFGETRIVMETVRIDILRAEVAAPAEGDVLIAAGSTFRVIGTPRSDAGRLVWTLEAARI